MFHATIRTSRDALHIIGEVDPYNLQTLQQHVRGASRDANRGAVYLLIQVNTRDGPEFARYAQPWLQRLKSRGVRVDVQVGPPLPRAAPSSSINHGDAVLCLKRRSA